MTKVIFWGLRCAHDYIAGKQGSLESQEETVREKLTHKWLPVVVEDACTGCGLCVTACGPGCLETQKLVAILSRPEDCGSEEHCIRACPDDAIRMVWVPSKGDRSRGCWRSAEQIRAGFCSAPDEIPA